jgi:hypothetical protein
MTEEDKKLSLALPGEWALQKVLGPVLSEIGEDLKNLYARGRDMILAAAYRKLRDDKGDKKANLRVARDVLWSGAFTDEEICAEYFGGILASSRTEDGKDDHAVQFVDIAKALSSKQLNLHYVVYHSLNKLLTAAGQPINVGLGSELEPQKVWFSAIELKQNLELRIDTDFHVLHRRGLISDYRIDFHDLGDRGKFPYVFVGPTSFGVLFYAVAHNNLDQWLSFDQTDFGEFPDISLPNYYARKLEDLLKQLNLDETALESVKEATSQETK